jgi:hypothetical protein
MPVEIKKGMGKVSVKTPSGAEQNTEEEVVEQKFYGPTANVGVSVATTRNLGNYESVKIGISLNMPCNPNEEAIEQACKFAQGWVDKKMQEVLEEGGFA